MDEPSEKLKPDSDENVRSPRKSREEARPWTQEEMDAAEPFPLPEVPDDDAGAREVTTTRISDVRVTHDRIIVELIDGDSVALPLREFPRLFGATEEQRDRWRIIADGMGVRWEALDEYLSLETILARRPSG